jgi:hypothetical protein
VPISAHVLVDHLRSRLVPLTPREALDPAAELRDRDRLAKAHLEIGGAWHAAAGRQRVEGARQVHGQHVDVALERQGKSLNETSIEDMEQLWQQAKREVPAS